MKDGIPIGAGYLAVSFSLGIYASGNGNGLTPLQGFIASFFTIASAGEYAGFSVILKAGGYAEMALVILVANCRYLLMSCALSQRVLPDLRLIHRIGMGAFITDEIFGITIAQNGYPQPMYTYGAAIVSVIPWAVGTALGITMGNILPAMIVNALSVAIYGMFLAIIVPPARKEPVIAGAIAIAFVLNSVWRFIPFLKDMSDGIRVVVLTVLLASALALLFPLKEEAHE